MEKPSTSLAGLLDTAEVPNLKELFRDENLGVCAVHWCGEKPVIHSEVFGGFDRGKLGLIQEVNVMIDEAFRKRGISKLYTWAETDEQYRYNQFLGYKPNGKEVMIPGYDTPVFEFEKEL